ncbi:MAG TPA: hypothetical protein PLK90_08385 [Clostridiales bacterium]|nr:hypothetical protein [Clostridiales bacterium]HQP70399.1 hypothetical protein [Clostridiales bacterium]
MKNEIYDKTRLQSAFDNLDTILTELDVKDECSKLYSFIEFKDYEKALERAELIIMKLLPKFCTKEGEFCEVDQFVILDFTYAMYGKGYSLFKLGKYSQAYLYFKDVFDTLQENCIRPTGDLFYYMAKSKQLSDDFGKASAFSSGKFSGFMKLLGPEFPTIPGNMREPIKKLKKKGDKK